MHTSVIDADTVAQASTPEELVHTEEITLEEQEDPMHALEQLDCAFEALKIAAAEEQVSLKEG